MMNLYATLKFVVLLLVFGFLEYSVLAVKREFPSCRSGDTCIRLTDCIPYMNLIRSLRRPLSGPAVSFLRKQECGFDGMYPMVCCFPSNTRKPQGNRVNSLENKGYPSHTPTPYVPSNQNIDIEPEKKHEETYQHSRRPDLTPGDLSDYRLYKIPNKDFFTLSSTTTTTTEKVKTTTRLFRRRVNNNNYGYLNKVVAAQTTRKPKNDEATRKRADELKRKMEAINKAFMYSPMDYFFAWRMDNEKDNKNVSIQTINMEPEEDHQKIYKDLKKPDLIPDDLEGHRSFKLDDYEELKTIIEAINDAFMYSADGDFVRRMGDERGNKNISIENINMEPEDDHKKIYKDSSKKPDLTPGDFDGYSSNELDDNEEMKKKIEAINDAFMYSANGEFVRRMDEKEGTKNISSQNVNMNSEGDYKETYQDSKKPDLTPGDLSNYRSFRPKDKEELKKKMEAIDNEFTYSVVDFVRRMDDGKDKNSVSEFVS